MTFIAQIVREELIRCIPEGGVVAEIGVAGGDFASAILANARPRQLHLIDPWVFQEREDYISDESNSGNDVQRARYAHVLDRFSGEIVSGNVVVHRTYSEEVLPSFPEAYFDWLYVDGMHTRDAVLQDLRISWPKVKPDGFLLGHDYTNHHFAEQQGFGVIDAVNAFVAETGALFLAFNMDIFPSYVLAKPGGANVKEFVASLLARAEAVVELRGAPKTYQHKLYAIDDKVISVPSF